MPATTPGRQKMGWLNSRFDLQILLATFAVAVIGALHLPSWNDGSRLATAECLVDYHTWQIDQSIFQPVTGDKLFIEGHFYSDKSPVPELAMAAVYKILQYATGLKAAQTPNLFRYLMALIFSGSAYVLSVFWLNRLMMLSRLPIEIRLPLVASFAFGTIALTYSSAVNVHVLMLAVFAGLFLLLAHTAEPGWVKFSRTQLCAIGTLLGVGYSIDLGVGPVLVLCSVGFLCYCTRSIRSVILVLALAFPWFALHHALNYLIGGTFFPANGVAQYFLYPGSAFIPQELTGAGWAHHGFVEFLVYGVSLLFGEKGFIAYNPILFLAIPATVVGWRETRGKRGLVCFSLGLIIVTWLLFAATSNNYSGLCCSIRWFVPLLVPFYYLLILALKRYPAALPDLMIFAGWSMVLGILLWVCGPWTPPMGPLYWYVNAAMFICWLVYCRFRTEMGLFFRNYSSVVLDCMRETTLAGAASSGVSGRRGKWMNVNLAVLEPLSVVGLFVFLLGKTWLQWGDPMIDFPRDLYIAWRLSEGDLLYQKIANWYGPLANLVEGTGFWAFGVGLDTMVWMNFVLTVVLLLLLRAIFGAIGNRLSVWLGSVVFLGVFVFGNLSDIANYNFITPYVAQSTYSLFGLLLVLWGLLRHLKAERPIWLAMAGLGLAVAYLDKPEAVLAAAGAIGIYLMAQSVRVLRKREPVTRWLRPAVSWLAGGFLSLWVPVFVYFSVRGGAVFALDATNRVLTTILDGSIRQTILSQHLTQVNMGFDRPWENFLIEVKAGGCLLSVCGTMALAAWIFRGRRAFSLIWCFALFGMSSAAILGGWLGLQADTWQRVGPAFVLPVIGTALVAIGCSLRTVWRGSGDFSRALGLAVVGVAASLMLARMILHPVLSHYGFFMMPLAVWFCIHLIIVEAARCGANTGEDRANCLLAAIFSALVLFAVGVLLRTELDLYSTKTYQIGVGRDRFYTYQPHRTVNDSLTHPMGPMLDTMMRAYKLKTPSARTLVAFPEGIAVNYHLRVPTPLAELEFNPAVLGYVGTQHILRELQDNPPDAVGLFARDYPDYGMKYFGSEEASGRSIVLWLSNHYNISAWSSLTSTSATGHVVDLAVPKTANDGLLPVLTPGK